MTAISGVSKLSWRAIEQDYSLNEFEKELRFICLRKRYYKKPLVMISAGLACGGFSLLFGGDFFCIYLHFYLCNDRLLDENEMQFIKNLIHMLQ